MNEENQNTEDVKENQNNTEEQTKEPVKKDAFDKESFKKELFKEWQEELEKTKNMNAKEKAQYELDNKIKATKDKELELAKRELRLDAHNILVDKNLNPKLLDILDYTNKENCLKSIDLIENITNEVIQEGIQKGIEERLKGKTPKQPLGNENTNSLEDDIRRSLGLK